jgi:hypothetical protein
MGKRQLRLLAIVCGVLGGSGLVFISLFWGKLNSLDLRSYAHLSLIAFVALCWVGVFLNNASQKKE